MIGLLITTGLVILFYSQVPSASAASLFVPFGGYTGVVVPNTNPAGMLICPTYTLVTNSDTTNGLPSIFGIYIPLAIPFPTYDNNNLYTPATPIIGGVETILCPAPVPVYPLFLDATGPFYLAGTGAF